MKKVILTETAVRQSLVGHYVGFYLSVFGFRIPVIMGRFFMKCSGAINNVQHPEKVKKDPGMAGLNIRRNQTP